MLTGYLMLWQTSDPRGLIDWAIRHAGPANGKGPRLTNSSWDSITAEWMTAALADAFPGVEVSGVEVVLRDDGTNRRARLGLTYSAGDGPSTVFVKAADPAQGNSFT